MSKKKQTTKETNQVIDTKDYFKKGWTKPTNPSPAPDNIAPLPPQGSGGDNSKPRQGAGDNSPPKQNEGGSTDSKGK